MSQTSLEYQHTADHRRDRNERRLRLVVLAMSGLVSTFILFLAVFLIYANYHQTFQVKRLFAYSGDWNVVEITGYSEGPGYSVTGVLLAMKDRPDATVRLTFDHWTSLRDNEEVSIVSINGLEVEDVQRRLRDDPRMCEKQRYYLRYHNGSIDVQDDFHFAGLFPHPIRDLKDLRTHYDEVYETLRSIAAGQRPALHDGSRSGTR